MDAAQLDDIRTTLARQRSEIERRLNSYRSTVGTAGEKPDQEGFADSAHVAAERSETLSLIDQLQQTHAEVSRALDRIEQGTYGHCERCGGEIPAERLEVIPTASLCVACKQLSVR